MKPELESATRKIIERIDKDHAPEVDILTGIMIGELRPFLSLDAIEANPEEISKIIVRHSSAILGIGVKMGIKSVLEFVDAARLAESSAEKVAVEPGLPVQ